MLDLRIGDHNIFPAYSIGKFLRSANPVTKEIANREGDIEPFEERSEPAISLLQDTTTNEQVRRQIYIHQLSV